MGTAVVGAALLLLSLCRTLRQCDRFSFMQTFNQTPFSHQPPLHPTASPTAGRVCRAVDGAGHLRGRHAGVQARCADGPHRAEPHRGRRRGRRGRPHGGGGCWAFRCVGGSMGGSWKMATRRLARCPACCKLLQLWLSPLLLSILPRPSSSRAPRRTCLTPRRRWRRARRAAAARGTARRPRTRRAAQASRARTPTGGYCGGSSMDICEGACAGGGRWGWQQTPRPPLC